MLSKILKKTNNSRHVLLRISLSEILLFEFKSLHPKNERESGKRGNQIKDLKETEIGETRKQY